MFALACEHSAPFRLDEGGFDEPFVSGSPARITYNPGQDLVPAWLADGSGLVYTAERGDRADHDRCFAFLPATGGTITRYACSTVPADDSINVFDEAALLGDSIAYVRASTERFLQGLGPDRQELVIAPIADPTAARFVQRVPFTTPWGDTYDAITNVAWLDPGRLAFIGERVTYPRACSNCVADTVRRGVGVVIIDVTSASPTLTRMPDGDSASSLAVAANGDTIYVTKNGDSHVFRHTLSTAQTDTLMNFGDIARDLSVRSGKLVAVVGGSPGGPGAPDRGGRLFLVTQQITGEIGDGVSLYRRPALSPDGARLVVSAWAGIATADLWLYSLR